MSDRYMTLMGAEQVQSAANRMSAAADQMARAAATFDDTMQRHHQFLDDWLQRYEAILTGARNG